MQKEKNTSKQVLEIIFTLKKEIDSSPLQRRSITTLISDLPIGRNLLEKYFKHMTGKTIIRYQLEKRMEAACALLKDGDMNCQQTAVLCGYRDQANFTSDFKKILKQSPSDWQRIHCEYSIESNASI